MAEADTSKEQGETEHARGLCSDAWGAFESCGAGLEVRHFIRVNCPSAVMLYTASHSSPVLVVSIFLTAHIPSNGDEADHPTTVLRPS
jgi:hypothetical protein